MPIYEFYSPDTHKIYSFYARRLMPDETIPLCPDGPSRKMEKMISRFAFIGRAKETLAGDPRTEVLDPRQEVAMMELAREMEGAGDAEPDPKTLGKMMRRMMEITGQKATGEMEEMMRRLESGEDPDKLEEEFGDVMENLDLPDGENASPDSLRSALSRHLKRSPDRDPTLYEMADYLPSEPQNFRKKSR